MTRFQIAIISDEGIKTSTEFNGDGYWDGYGQQVYEALQGIKSIQEWKDYVTKFNSETFEYYERLHYNVPDNYLDMSTDYYDKWFSDYVYIKNITDESVELITKNGRTSLAPGEVGVFNFGTRLVPYTEEEYICDGHWNKLIEKLEEHGFTVSHEGDEWEFGKYSPAGQDFWFTVYADDMDELAEKVLDYYENFDVSEEAYLWLDHSGHGKNGAPYDMKDVYEDMKSCEDYIDEVYEIIQEVRS